jgi:hypothetical protein
LPILLAVFRLNNTLSATISPDERFSSLAEKICRVNIENCTPEMKKQCEKIIKRKRISY